MLNPSIFTEELTTLYLVIAIPEEVAFGYSIFISQCSKKND